MIKGDILLVNLLATVVITYGYSYGYLGSLISVTTNKTTPLLYTLFSFFSGVRGSYEAVESTRYQARICIRLGKESVIAEHFLNLDYYRGCH
jgi:hypothetical protein